MNHERELVWQVLNFEITETIIVDERFFKINQLY